ncbi:MAG: DnaJ domain-containing protein [bacterium]|nr:DnaJ domain-containing protein [bacterium]
MGTLYDLLGALPGDDAEGLRKAFRKAAKAAHPDIDRENPEAAARFRELVRAYDILSDAEQRATYDQLLTIALQPQGARAARTYEGIRKFASSTMAATLISAVLVGGYAVLGLFSNPPVAAEILGHRPAGNSGVVTAIAPTDVVATNGATPTVSTTMAAATGTASVFDRLEPVPAFAAYNPGIKNARRFAAAYFDRDMVLYRMGSFDRPFADVSAVRRVTDLKRTRSAPVPPRRIAGPVPLPIRRMPMTAALTP